MRITTLGSLTGNIRQWIIKYCMAAKVLLQLAAMEKDTDINKVVRQHLEMEQFFSGFTPRGKTGAGEPREREDNMAVAEKTVELQKIAEEVRQCRKCGLGSLRTNAVPGEGDSDARIMFVGEGPGADEDAQGRPFVGRAGQLLDKIIAACGQLSGYQRPQHPYYQDSSATV